MYEIFQRNSHTSARHRQTIDKSSTNHRQIIDKSSMNHRQSSASNSAKKLLSFRNFVSVCTDCYDLPTKLHLIWYFLFSGSSDVTRSCLFLFFFRSPSRVTLSQLSAPPCILRDVVSCKCNSNVSQIFCRCLQLHLHTTHCHCNFLRQPAPVNRKKMISLITVFRFS